MALKLNQPYAPTLLYQVERSSGRVAGTMTNDAETGIVPDTLTLLLYDVDSGTVINGRNRQDVLNANGVTVGAGGAFEWRLAADDNQIVGTSVPVQTHQRHRALFEWTFPGGHGKAEIDVLVHNLGFVPATP